MLEVERIGQRGRSVTGSGQNGNEIVAGDAIEAFTRWLPPAAACRFAARYLVCWYNDGGNVAAAAAVFQRTSR